LNFFSRAVTARGATSDYPVEAVERFFCERASYKAPFTLSTAPYVAVRQRHIDFYIISQCETELIIDDVNQFSRLGFRKYSFVAPISQSWGAIYINGSDTDAPKAPFAGSDMRLLDEINALNSIAVENQGQILHTYTVKVGEQRT